MFDLNETIAALASAPGAAVAGIIRLSGGDVKAVLSGLLTFDDLSRWNSTRRASTHAGHISLKDFETPLPVTVYLWNSHRSYTGQPMAELHTFGSPPILESLLTKLHQQGVRPARPGEFTLRSFLAGRIDLVQAEAVLGVIDAEDHVELNTALQQLAGGISTQLATVQNNLIDLLADLEAGLDFVDEEIEFVSRENLLTRLQFAQKELTELNEQSQSRMRMTGQKKVVLAGLPNAGKSTLFNKLAQREAALVSEISGTTRDYLSTEVCWQGIDIELIDTAGWDEEVSGIDQMAQTQRAEQFDRADLLLWCSVSDGNQHLEEEILLNAKKNNSNSPIIIVHTKQDLVPEKERKTSKQQTVQISAQTGFGIPKLISEIVTQLCLYPEGNKYFAGSTAARCRESLSSAVTSLQNAIKTAQTNLVDEMIAIELRDVLEQLGHILGTVYTDDILDRIFSKFCIGK